MFIIQEFNEDIHNPIHTYYPFILDLLFIYPDKEIIVKNIKLLPKKVNLVKFENKEKYEVPLAIILNPSNNAYMTQNFDDVTKSYLLENSYVILKIILL